MRASVFPILASISIAIAAASCTFDQSGSLVPDREGNGGSGGGTGGSGADGGSPEPPCDNNQTVCGNKCCNDATHECVEKACVVRTKCEVGAICGTGRVCNENRMCVEGCSIGGAPQPSGHTNPDNICQICNPALGPGWSPNTDASCAANGVCDTNGKCARPPTIAAGSRHTCGVTATGSVKCWGSNLVGQLGKGPGSSSSLPVQALGLTSGVIAVSAGARHTCALTESGAVLCWGLNREGQIGDDTTEDRDIATPVNGLGTGVTAISAGLYHTCALMEFGSVVCWGTNQEGQIGDGTNLSRSVPTPVIGLPEKAVDISAGGYHSCAVMEGGTDWCWGGGKWGQLGNGGIIDRSTPAKVNNSANISSIVTGYLHTCDISASGALRCWGANDQGQLGYDSPPTKPNPGPVPQFGTNALAVT
ncbi:MAG: hypothetical protein FWD57_04985, partial [Polyangiaceae bacterium]|nr:hypothetical protein [Polyangiaceae bacterium]